MADSGNFSAWLNYLLTIQTEIGRKAAFEGPGAQEFFSYGSDVRRKYINLAVRFELKHIPRGERRSLQNLLRFSYSALRRKHIRLGVTRHETLRELVGKISKAHPDFIPKYDEDFFKL